MTHMPQKRHPKGSPQGGQYAPNSRPDTPKGTTSLDLDFDPSTSAATPFTYSSPQEIKETVTVHLDTEGDYISNVDISKEGWNFAEKFESNITVDKNQFLKINVRAADVLGMGFHLWLSERGGEKILDYDFEGGSEDEHFIDGGIEFKMDGGSISNVTMRRSATVASLRLENGHLKELIVANFPTSHKMSIEDNGLKIISQNRATETACICYVEPGTRTVTCEDTGYVFPGY